MLCSGLTFDCKFLTVLFMQSMVYTKPVMRGVVQRLATVYKWSFEILLGRRWPDRGIFGEVFDAKTFRSERCPYLFRLHFHWVIR